MEYRIKESGELVSEDELRRRNPNVSLPAVFDAATCEFLGVDPVLAAPQPPCGELEIVVRDGVAQSSQGNWVEKYSVKPRFSDIPLADGTVKTGAEQESEYRERKQEERAAQVRAERNRRIEAVQNRIDRWQRETRMGLTPTDDIAVLDACIQALAEVPEQKGFPFDVKWPDVPV